MQLGVFGTVAQLSGQLRALGRIAPRLKEGGLVRKLAVDRTLRRRAVGLSAASRRIGAFGGLLYAAGALAHEVVASGADITHSRQRSRLDVGDASYLEADRRLKWRT